MAVHIPSGCYMGCRRTQESINSCAPVLLILHVEKPYEICCKFEYEFSSLGLLSSLYRPLTRNIVIVSNKCDHLNSCQF